MFAKKTPRRPYLYSLARYLNCDSGSQLRSSGHQRKRGSVSNKKGTFACSVLSPSTTAKSALSSRFCRHCFNRAGCTASCSVFVGQHAVCQSLVLPFWSELIGDLPSRILPDEPALAGHRAVPLSDGLSRVAVHSGPQFCGHNPHHQPARSPQIQLCRLCVAAAVSWGAVSALHGAG